MFMYALANRPFGIGTAPKDCLQTLPQPAPGEPHHEVALHGIVCYQRELTPDEVKAFELPRLLGPKDLPQLAALISDEMAEYAKGYLDMADKSPAHFADRIKRSARAVWPGYPPSVADPAALLHAVRMNLARHRETQLDAQIQEQTALQARIVAMPSGGEHWFALGQSGAMISLGKHASSIEAKAALEASGHQAIRLFDEQSARQWQNAFALHLPPDYLTARPRALITVSGGVASVNADPNVEVEVFDFDNYKVDPQNTSKVPAHFADLAQAAGAPYEGDDDGDQLSPKG